MGGKGNKRRLRDGKVAGRLARRLEHELGDGLEPARSPLRLRNQGMDIVVRHAEVAADLDVMRPLIGRASEIAHLQDGKLAQARIEPALEADELTKPTEGTQAVRAVGKRTMQRDVPRQ
jgi:hypothetical protein